MGRVGAGRSGWFRSGSVSRGGFGRSPPPLTLRECGAVGASRRLYSISKVRAVSLSTVMRTVTTFSGSSGSIFSGHSTRQRSPE